MQLNLEHDWQGNMSTPRARIGERAKIRLLLILCGVWLLMGLVGHEPWKPFESSVMSTVTNILDHGSFITPTSAANQHQIHNPPLYYLSAALTASALSGILPLHDGARIATGLWMLLTLVIIGMTGRELWGRGFGRQTSFIFISAIGLVVSAHTISPAVSGLTGMAACFYALALAKRRPYRASALLGTGMGVGFLSVGLVPVTISLLTCAILPACFKHWRTSRFAKVVGIAILIASPMILGWTLLCLYLEPKLFNTWLGNTLLQFSQLNHVYFLNLLLWFAWPSLPLAAWALWRYRTRLLNQAKFQLCITFFIVALLCIGMGENKNIYALPLLIPLTALAGGSIETLKRGAASALNWFGLILFGFLGFLIWLGWSAMMSGNPAKLKERLTFLSGLTELDFNIFAFVTASAITIIWLFAAFRTQHSNRAAATNWAIGITLVWTLLMTLWLPMIDSARSYRDVFTNAKNALPAQYHCIASKGVGKAQRDLLHYYTKIKTNPINHESDTACDLLLVQDGRRPLSINLDNNWRHTWSGKRISERKESFRLFQRTP